MPTLMRRSATGLVFVATVCLSLAAHASFEETLNRYPSPFGTIELLKRAAPYRSNTTDPCLQIEQVSAPVIGAIDPLQLQPLETQPGALYFSYFENCTKQIVSLGLADESNAAKNSELILGKELTKNAIRTLGVNSAQALWSAPFSKMPTEMQNLVFDQFILFILGPEEVIRHFKYIGGENVFRQNLETIEEFRRFLILNLGSTGSLMEVYARTVVFLRLGPVLNN